MHQPESDRAATERAVGRYTDEPTGMEVMGPLHHAQFPKLCVKCGTSTTRTLPGTNVLRAIDFTADRSELFDAERRLLTLHVEVRANFAELNANRRWKPTSTRARLADKAR